MDTCSVDECTREPVYTGKCRPHYNRGDREIGEGSRYKIGCRVEGCKLSHFGRFSVMPGRECWLRDFVDRFVSGLIDDYEECQTWPFDEGNIDGYLTFTKNKREMRATHFVLGLLGDPRPDPPNDVILHTCPGGDNPSCINPLHIEWGTVAENNRHTVERGRWVPPKDGVSNFHRNN